MPAGLSTDGGATSVEFDLDEMTSDQAIAIEDAAGLTWLEFARGLRSGSAKAYRALAWILQRQENPDLELDDVVFRMSDFTIKGEAAGPLSEESGSSSDGTPSSSTSSTESSPGNGDG